MDAYEASLRREEWTTAPSAGFQSAGIARGNKKGGVDLWT
jgi:hypothetical protein